MQHGVGGGAAGAGGAVPVVSSAFRDAGAAPGRVVHFVTGDPLAFAHTAKVIGGVEGEIIPLPVTELAEEKIPGHG